MEPFIQVVAPGRINLIGEHVDYAGGIVLPVAIDRDIRLVARWNENPREHRFRAADREKDVHIPAHFLRRSSEVNWPNYLMGAIETIEKVAGHLPGISIFFEGCIPKGAGMSSSAALTLAALEGVRRLAGVPELLEADLMKACQSIEHEWAGVTCGLMDFYASFAAKEGHALLLDCSTLTHQDVPLPNQTQYAWICCHSLVPRTLRNSDYNDRPREIQEIARLLGIREGSEGWARLDFASLDGRRHLLSDRQYRRACHIVTEIERVRSFVAALQQADTGSLGRLLAASHASLRDDFEVSCPELNELVELAVENAGALGARMMGGGFGGCTINLVERAKAEVFAETITREFYNPRGKESAIFQLQSVDGLRYQGEES